MDLNGTLINELSAEDINRLITNKFQENRTLDYKCELNLSLDKDRKEFLYDIAAMSNTEGGCLIFGIKELLDEHGQNTGTPDVITGIVVHNSDKLIQQIEDIIRSSTEPSISGIELKVVPVKEFNVLVIGVPKSFGLPVMTTFKGTNKFYKRRNSGKYLVDVHELGSMFTRNYALKVNAESFRFNRIEKAKTYRIFPNLQLEGGIFIHVVPFNYEEQGLLDLTVLPSELALLMQQLENSYGTHAIHNFDGYVTYRVKKDLIYSYCQLFRNGAYEVFSSGLFEHYRESGGQLLFHVRAKDLCEQVLKQFDLISKILKLYKIQSPFLVSLSMINIKNAVISYGTNWSNPFQVEDLTLPPVIMQSYDSNPKELLRPIFDIIWQSIGESRCNYFPE